MSVYPLTERDRDRWIRDHRPPRNALDPRRPYALLMEMEPGPDGRPVEVATVFLTNRECPWRCLMCDLWQNTLEESVPAGAITAQVEFALEHLKIDSPLETWLKLYNAGSFFDPRAIPPAEYTAIARLAAPFRRVIVECHPALVGERCLAFRDMLSGKLEVALGLETAHPDVLARLNKRMTLDDFAAAARFLTGQNIDVRSFILLRPPWLTEAEGIDWAARSLSFAFDCGASVCSLIPTRAGNGAMEALMAAGEFSPPSLAALELALEAGLATRRGRVFADLWDIEKLPHCPACASARIERIRVMNQSQAMPAGLKCGTCAPTNG